MFVRWLLRSLLIDSALLPWDNTNQLFSFVYYNIEYTKEIIHHNEEHHEDGPLWRISWEWFFISWISTLRLQRLLEPRFVVPRYTAWWYIPIYQYVQPYHVSVDWYNLVHTIPTVNRYTDTDREGEPCSEQLHLYMKA